MINVRDIVRDYLVANGYDGLAGHDCGCLVSDLMPCSESQDGCKPGHRVECKGCEVDGPCPWHIVPGRKK